MGDGNCERERDIFSFLCIPVGIQAEDKEQHEESIV